MNNVETFLENNKLLAVLTIEDENTAVPLAKALFEGGVKMVELTLRTPTAFESIKRIRQEVPDMVVAAGTLIEPRQVEKVLEAGAHYAVAPATNRRILEETQRQHLPFAPGVMTPSDIENALEFNCKTLKFFPANSCGGIQHLEYMCVPYNHLGLKYIALGGINAQNFVEVLKKPMIAALGGSWLATPQQIKDCNCAAIKAQAQHAVALLEQHKI